MMDGINLLPAEMRQVNASRRRARAWAAGLSVWAGACLLAGAGLRASLPPNADGLTPEIEAKVRQAADADCEAEELAAAIRGLQREAETARAVSAHPDWSVLLRLLGAAVSDDVVLESCELSREAAAPVVSPGGAPKAPAAPTAPGLTLKLAGYAESPASVADLALRLEKSGVFASVRIAETRPRSLGPEDRTAFKVECRVRGSGAGGGQ